MSDDRKTNSPTSKIGLALSGGGFRASIFHLGVIRRLEELGIMKDVNVLSTVSGGSIIGAYYACEMERRLRKKRNDLKQNPSAIDTIRLELFEQISRDFFGALRHNMRSRALLFGPFYHPLLFAKSLWPGVSRSDLIQKEYDLHLFSGSRLYPGYSLASLPNVTETPDNQPSYLVGPELVINATSLLTGERISLSRRTLSGVTELKKNNSNILPIARAVGASAGVPGLFPPTQIAGQLLVDGGVSDNQGIDGLLREGRSDNHSTHHDALDDPIPEDDFDLIIVSDASGQIEQLDSMPTKATTVMSRTMSIFQHELRNKELKSLIDWKTQANLKQNVELETQEAQVSFAFVHLFQDLKSRVDSSKRVPSEYISAIARIRTDLDQFSMIEREALMYHGYTLIDAQLKKYCSHFIAQRNIPELGEKLRRPPLFDDSAARGNPGSTSNADGLDRRKIKRELVAGSKPLFVLRSMLKFPFVVGIPAVLCWFTLIGAYVFWVHSPMQNLVGGQLGDWILAQIKSIAPQLAQSFLNWAIGDELFECVVKAVVRLTTLMLQFAALLYVLGFATYITLRRTMLKLDQHRYKKLTGEDYSVSW